MGQAHGTNSESGLFDALENPAGVFRRDGVRLDDGKMCGPYPSNYMSKPNHDFDEHIGAGEGDRPSDCS